MSDTNLYSFAGTAPGTYSIQMPQPGQHVKVPAEWGGYEGVFHPDQFSDVLKFSNCHGINIICHGKAHGGKEDVVDMNNHTTGCYVTALEGFVSHGEYVWTCKGGSRDNVITGPILRHGGTVDCDFGNWSDQSNEPAVGNVIRVSGRCKARKLNAKAIEWSGATKLKKSIWLPDWMGPVFVFVYGLIKKLL